MSALESALRVQRTIAAMTSILSQRGYPSQAPRIDWVTSTPNVHKPDKYDLPMVRFRGPRHICVDLARVDWHFDRMQESIVMLLLAEAMATYAIYREFETRIELRRSSRIVSTSVAQPVLQPYGSPRWEYWRDKFITVADPV